MDSKKPTGGLSSGRLFCFFSVALWLFAAHNYLIRELWFDEVLTLKYFASLPSIPQIYRTYTIPNNQLIHTFFLHGLLNAGFSPEVMRLFPLVCGAGTIILLWKNFHRETGKFPLAVTLAALAFSPPFLLYATALRGYMLAAFFTVCALCCGKRYALAGNIHYLAGWFFFSLLTVGVMPSALAGIAGAGLFLVPYCGKKFWKNRRLYRLAAAPFAAFILFYAPIYRDLLKAFELKEGWHHGGYALLAVSVAVLTTFLIPLAAGIFFHRPALRNLPRMVIWFLPLAGAVLPVAPFPRVWFVLFPLFALLAAGYLRKVPATVCRVLIFAAIIWGLVTVPEFSRELLSPAVSLAGQDDFYAPRFLDKDFRPSSTAEFLNNSVAEEVPVFVSFAADPFALWYFRQTVILDIPPGKLRRLPPGTLIVTDREEAPEDFGKRFGTALREIFQNELHRVYKMEDSE